MRRWVRAMLAKDEVPHGGQRGEAAGVGAEGLSSLDH
jgi:hypothetical protein